MKLFVTGATGVIGRRAVPRLVDAGHDVRAMARSPEKAGDLERTGARPVTGVDLFDGEALRAAIAGHDAVVNLATHIPPTAKAMLPGAWKENDRIRRECSTFLADAAIAAGVEAFVQESVTFGYADGGDRWLDERAPIELPAVIDATGVAEANAARVAVATGGRGITLRFGQFLSADSSHVQDAVRTARRGLSPFLGPEEGYTSWVTADDAGNAVAAALAGAPTGVWNVAEDEPSTRAELADALAVAVGRGRLRAVPAPAARVAGGKASSVLQRSQRISNRRFKDATGWAPTTKRTRDVWADLASAIDA